MSRILGIDLGTTNTVVAVSDELGGVRALAAPGAGKLIPSVVSFDASGRVLVGDAANERKVLDPANTVYSIKRLFGVPFASTEGQRAAGRFPFAVVPTEGGAIAVKTRAGTFELPEISAFVLREAKRVAEAATGEAFDRIVLTVPANFTDLQRSATRAAAKIAGLDVVRILNEPTAAALAYGLATGGAERVVIYDFGGGTFDVTVLELAGAVFEVVSTAGDMFLGGDDVDRVLVDLFAEQFASQHRVDPRSEASSAARLRAAAEWAKSELSIMQMVDVHVPGLVTVGGKALDLFVRLNQPAYEQRIRPVVERTLAVTQEALRLAKIAPSQVDNIVLVGGSSRIPLVRRLVEQQFGKAPLATMDPDLVVALGAAVQARSLEGTPSESELVPVAHRPSRPPAAKAKAPPPRVPRPSLPPPPPDLVAKQAADSSTPLLVDVTPFTLGVETVGGYCETVIPRNAPIPCEQNRSFSTAHDGQTRVRLRVCQGESRRFDENQPLGELILDDLPARARGAVQLRVTFTVDADGTLQVDAIDLASGVRQSARLRRAGEIDDASVDALRDKHDAMTSVSA